MGRHSLFILTLDSTIGLCNFVGQRPAIKRFAETRSQLRYGAVTGDWGPSTNKQFCGAKSQSVYHSALLASFVRVPITTSQKDSTLQKSAVLFGDS